MPNHTSSKSNDGWIIELLGELVSGTFTLAWRFRTELVTLSAPWWLCNLLTPIVGKEIGVLLALTLTVAALLIPRSRRWIFHRLYVSRMRRRWERACRQVELTDGDDKPSTVRDGVKTAAGDRLVIRIHRGGSVDDLDLNSERLASALAVREVRVLRDPGNAKFAHVSIALRDPLDVSAPLRWPYSESEVLSLWQPIPVGVDDDGGPVFVHLPERNVLIGGEPGAGKSVALSMIVAAAALDPTVKLWLLDGKQVELASWAPVAERSVGPSIEDAISLLRDLQVEMDKRYTSLLEAGLRKVEPGLNMPMHLVVCDELAFYLTVSDRKLRTEFSDLMRDLVSRGRAAGIVVVAATQKPSHDIIPTSLRDLFGFRWALRCNTPQASDTILGAGWASQGFDASSVAGFQRGVGFLLAEESSPRRLLSYYLSDGDLDHLAQRARTVRGQEQGGENAAL